MSKSKYCNVVESIVDGVGSIFSDENVIDMLNAIESRIDVINDIASIYTLHEDATYDIFKKLFVDNIDKIDKNKINDAVVEKFLYREDIDIIRLCYHNDIKTDLIKKYCLNDINLSKQIGVEISIDLSVYADANIKFIMPEEGKQSNIIKKFVEAVSNKDCKELLVHALDKATVRSLVKSFDNSSDKTLDKSTDKTTDKTLDKTLDKASN